MGRLFLLFVLVPIVEIWLIGVVGHAIGFWPTFGLLLLSGILGAWFAKREGLRVLRDWQTALAQGRMPESGILDGLLVLVGGVLMVAPGFLTDTVGLLLVVPVTRRIAARFVRRWVEARIATGSIRVTHVGGPGAGGAGGDGGGTVQGRVVQDETPDDASPRLPH